MMRFCANDGMWFCPRCTVHLGLADPAPRCPRCYATLALENDTRSLCEGVATAFGKT